MARLIVDRSHMTNDPLLPLLSSNPIISRNVVDICESECPRGVRREAILDRFLKLCLRDITAEKLACVLRLLNNVSETAMTVNLSFESRTTE